MEIIDAMAIRKLRRAASLSQGAVARGMGMSQSWLSNVELSYTVPTRRELFDIIATIRTLAALKKASRGNKLAE